MIGSKKKNILITGSGGFVGKSLTRELGKNLDNLFLVSRDKKFKYPGAKVFYGNLSDEKFCQKIVKNIDTVYYLAGYKKNVAYHTKYPSDFVFGNVPPLMSFLKAVKGSSVERIIYLSSTSVELYKEGEEDGYVIGKYINELIIKSFAKQSSVDVKVVRSAPIYGPGDNFDIETANFIPAMINKIYKGKEDLLVWGRGKRKLQFIFIDDLVSNLIKIGKERQKNFFVIGNPDFLTVNEIAKKLIYLSHKNMKIKNDLTKPDKASQLFKFINIIKPKVSFDEGLEKVIRYYKTLHA